MPQDDLEAVRDIVAALEEFPVSDRERIIRWAKEKLGMPDVIAPVQINAQANTASTERATQKKDIKTFVAEKSPKSDNEFAATVAYYYQFEAPDTERKDSIGKDDLVDACRKVPWEQPTRPSQTLINAEATGYIDKVSPGKYKLNSVGENLVVMVLSGKAERPKLKSKPKKKNAKRAKRN